MQNTIAQHVTKTQDGYELHIAVNEQHSNVRIDSITMFVSNDTDDCDGDLAVNWSADALTSKQVNDTMRSFYSDDAYTARLRELLVAAGFSKTAADDVVTSEWGMQDDGRASYDAALVADAVRNAM